MKIVQYGKIETWKECTMKKRNIKKCNTKIVHNENSETRKNCCTKRVQHGKSASWK